MREYRIYKVDRWWSISRKKYNGKIMMLQYLYGNGMRWPNKTIAKIFYTEDDAGSALSLIKIKDGKKSD